jgi:hypothetical protein
MDATAHVHRANTAGRIDDRDGHRACRLLDLRDAGRRPVFLVADRPVLVDVWALPRLFAVFLTTLLRAAAFFDDADLGVVAFFFLELLIDAFDAAPFFVPADLAGEVRLTDELVFARAAFFTGLRREVATRRAVEDFAARARLPVPARARGVRPVVTEPARLRPTTLRTPGPGIRLVCSPVLQRTVIIEPFTDVTNPARGPDLDVTSTRSPTTAMRSSSIGHDEYDPNEPCRSATSVALHSQPAPTRWFSARLITS